MNGTGNTEQGRGTPSNLGADSASRPALLGHGETVLLIEDEPSIRKLAHLGLTRQGFRVLDAGDAPEALTIWGQQAQEIDLVLADVTLPGGMSGIELVRKLRGERPNVKVIFASGYSVDTDALGEDAGADTSVVQKPYVLGALAAAVRASLDGAH